MSPIMFVLPALVVLGAYLLLRWLIIWAEKQPYEEDL